MNDHDLMTTLRASLDDVRMDVPVTDVVARGRALHARRLGLRATAGALTLALLVAVATALVTVVGGSPGGRGGTHVTLTAWTVRGTAGGPVAVTIRELVDVGGLEAQLHEHGVAAVVTASMAIPTGCTQWHDGQYDTGPIVTLASESGLPDANGVEFTIQPSEIPAGTLLWLGLAQSGAPAGSTGPAGPISMGLFDDTASCAGSPAG